MSEYACVCVTERQTSCEYVIFAIKRNRERERQWVRLNVCQGER